MVKLSYEKNLVVLLSFFLYCACVSLRRPDPFWNLEMTPKFNSLPSPLIKMFLKLNFGKILDDLASKLYLIGKPHVSSFQHIKQGAIFGVF